MTWVLIVLIVLFVVDVGRMRGRLDKLAVLPATESGDDTGYCFVVAPRVSLDAATRRAACAWATARGLAVVDLIPRDLPAIRAMSLAQIVDPVEYRRDRIAMGRTAGHAVLISTDVARRAGLDPAPTITPADEVAFFALAARLRHYAPAAADLVVAPAEHAMPSDPDRRKAVLRAVLGPSLWFALMVQPAFWIIMGLGVWLRPVVGGIALGVWHLQPLLSIVGTPIRSRDVLVATVFRAPIEIYNLIRTAFGRWHPPGEIDPIEALRPEYTRLAADPARYLEPRRDTCPICDGRDLVVHLRSTDLLQHKPGTFTLERCRGCGHIFQNPRLTIAGLNFYYKDFYDGLGEAGMEMIFGFGSGSYHTRARMVGDRAIPARWLDVGAGHGHFCCAAREDLPDTGFDGLDLSESIDEAKRRGWVDHAYRGLFPDLAPSFAGTYDAVSMSHYLEHTLDPRAELAAAHTALAPNGHLLIEVPDPEFGLGRLLGKHWLPWFQPQHQHFLSTTNLARLLREHGFEPLEWHRGAAHQRVDFFFATWLLLGRLGPPTRQPWRKRPVLGRLRRVTAWTLGAPFIALALITDRILEPFFRRGKVSNTYRVVARRDAAAVTTSGGSPGSTA